MTTRLRKLNAAWEKSPSWDTTCALTRAIIDAIEELTKADEQPGRGEPSRLELMAMLAAPTLARGTIGIHGMGPEAIAEICGAAAFCVDALTVQASEPPAPITTPRLAAARKDSGETDKPPVVVTAADLLCAIGRACIDWAEDTGGCHLCGRNDECGERARHHDDDCLVGQYIAACDSKTPCTGCAGMCRGPGPADDCAHADAQAEPMVHYESWKDPHTGETLFRPREPLPAELRERLGREAREAWLQACDFAMMDDGWKKVGERLYQLATADWQADKDGLIRAGRLAQDRADAAIARAEKAERERDRVSSALREADDSVREFGARIDKAHAERDDLRAKLATAEKAWRNANKLLLMCADMADSPMPPREHAIVLEWLDKHPAPKGEA